MSKKKTVYLDGRVANPFHWKKDGEGVWFYAARGKFEFVVQQAKDGVWLQPIQFSVPTRVLRTALKLVDSVRK